MKCKKCKKEMEVINSKWVQGEESDWNEVKYKCFCGFTKVKTEDFQLNTGRYDFASFSQPDG